MARYGYPLATALAALVLAPAALAAPSGTGILDRGTGADDVVAKINNNGSDTLHYARIFLPAGVTASNITVEADFGGATCMWDAGLNAIACQFPAWAPGANVQVKFTTTPHMADNAGAKLKVSADGVNDAGPFELPGPAPATPTRNPCSKKPAIDRPCADLSINIPKLGGPYPLGAYVLFDFQVANAGDDAANPFVSDVFEFEGKRVYGGRVNPPHPPGPGGYTSTFDATLLAGGQQPSSGPGGPGGQQTASPATAATGFLAGGGSDEATGRAGNWVVVASVTSDVTDPDLTNNTTFASYKVRPYVDTRASFSHRLEQGKPGKVTAQADTCAEASPPAACRIAQDATCQSLFSCAESAGLECLSTCTDPAPCSAEGQCGAAECTGAACEKACETQSCTATATCTAATCPGGRRTSVRLVRRALPAAEVKVKRVEIAIRRAAKRGRCSWLSNARAKLKSGACDKPIWLTAKRGTFKLKKGLPAGRYTLFSRGTNAAGLTENTFSKADGNLVAFTVG